MWQLPYQPVSGIIRIWGNFVDGTLKLREDDQSEWWRKRGREVEGVILPGICWHSQGQLTKWEKKREKVLTKHLLGSHERDCLHTLITKVF